jgi:hypothetical protein
MLLAMPSAELRASAATLVVNLLEDLGREAMNAAVARLEVSCAISTNLIVVFTVGCSCCCCYGRVQAKPA